MQRPPLRAHRRRIPQHRIHLQLGRQIQPVTASHLSSLPLFATLPGGLLTPRGLL